MADEPYRMKYLDEVRGPLTHIEETDTGLLALVGQVPVLLPLELESQLREMIGKRIGILRAEGCDYRLKFLDGKAHA